MVGPAQPHRPASEWGGSVPVGCLVIMMFSVAFGPPWWGRLAYLAKVR
jgi:hypothetical protein